MPAKSLRRSSSQHSSSWYIQSATARCVAALYSDHRCRKYDQSSRVPTADTVGRFTFSAVMAPGVGGGEGGGGAGWAVLAWSSMRRSSASGGVSAGHSYAQSGAEHLMADILLGEFFSCSCHK